MQPDLISQRCLILILRCDHQRRCPSVMIGDTDPNPTNDPTEAINCGSLASVARTGFSTSGGGSGQLGGHNLCIITKDLNRFQ